MKTIFIFYNFKFTCIKFKKIKLPHSPIKVYYKEIAHVSFQMFFHLKPSK